MPNTYLFLICLTVASIVFNFAALQARDSDVAKPSNDLSGLKAPRTRNAASKNAPTSASPSGGGGRRAAAPFVVVVTLLHNKGDNWKGDRRNPEVGDTGTILLGPEMRDLPVSVFSVDTLVRPSGEVEFFDPEVAYAHLLQNRTGEISFTPLLNGKRAQECPGYLTYILKHYDDLPDVSIFIHGSDGPRHNRYLAKDIRHVVDNWTPEEIGFLHLNDHWREIKEFMPSDRHWPDLWRLLGFRQPMPTKLGLQCCAQFMVTRERILLRPRWFYEQLLKITYEERKCAFQEHYWHIFFGEGPVLSGKRQVRNYRSYDRATGMATWKRPEPAQLVNPYPSISHSDSMLQWGG